MIKVEVKSRDLVKLIQLNQLVKKINNEYTIYETGNIIGTDDSRNFLNCMIRMRTVDSEKIYEILPHVENSAITIFAQTLFESTKSAKTLISHLSVSDEFELFLHKGEDKFLIGKYTDLSTSLMTTQSYTMYDNMIGSDRYQSLNDIELDVIKSNKLLTLTNGYLNTLVAKPLFPFISKTELSYTFDEIDESKFFIYIRLIREGFELTTRYECFSY